MTKVFWFSRHDMSDTQKQALITKLGQVDIVQSDKTIKNAFEVKDDINNADVIAIVAPINIQAQFLKIAGDKPVIMAVNDRVAKLDGGYDFVFKKWIRLRKIEVVTEDF